MPGWPYAFKDMNSWLSEVASVVNDKKAAKVQNFDGYEIWNEPDGTWKSTSIDFNSGLWKQTYDFLRKNDPNAKIIGPSYSWYNGNRMEEFVKYCSANNCMPDVISWHQWGSEGFAAVDSKKKFASIVVGGNTLGDVNVKIEKIPAFLGNKVNVDVEFVTWEDKDKAVPSTTMESTKEYEVVNGSITVPVNIKNVYYAYRVYITPSIPQAPFGEKAVTLPGKIEFENFDVGGEGKAYHDTDVENKGNNYRDEGVDIVEAPEGLALGYTIAGEWMEYTINVAETSKYYVSANVSTAMDQAGFLMFVDDKPILDSINIDKIDESFDVYKVVELGEVELEKGEHVLKVQVTKSYINLDWLNFRTEKEEAGGPEETAIGMQKRFDIARDSYKVYSLQGKLLGKVELNGKTPSNALTNSGYNAGVYILRSIAPGSRQTFMVNTTK